MRAVGVFVLLCFLICGVTVKRTWTWPALCGGGTVPLTVEPGAGVVMLEVDLLLFIKLGGIHVYVVVVCTHNHCTVSV